MIRNIIFFDFDGVLATPVFAGESGSILNGGNTFRDNFALYTQEPSSADSISPYSQYQKPVRVMQEIIKRYAEEGKYELGVLSRCSNGSVEIFAKLDFLAKHYSSYLTYLWKSHFYGVSREEDKQEVLLKFAQDLETGSEIVYVDDSLEALISIDQFFRHEYPSAITGVCKKVFLYHLTTFVEGETTDKRM